MLSSFRCRRRRCPVGFQDTAVHHQWLHVLPAPTWSLAPPPVCVGLEWWTSAGCQSPWQSWVGGLSRWRCTCRACAEMSSWRQRVCRHREAGCRHHNGYPGQLTVENVPVRFLSSPLSFIIIIILYIYHVLINALSAHMIHINLNMIFYTHVEHSSTKTIYIEYY